MSQDTTTTEPIEEPTFVVQTSEFEGPLDLLLRLIQKRKLFISDIALSEVTDDYVQYIQEHPQEISDLTAFIETATTLMLIKSKALLPELDLTREEENSIEDLQDRLRAYRRVKEIEVNVQELFGTQPLFFHVSKSSSKSADIFAPGENCTLENVHLSAQSVLDKLPVFTKDHAAVKKTVRLEDVIERVKNHINRQLHTSFKDMHDRSEKSSIILSFLALLELVKLGEVEARQDDQFSDITLESKNPGVPQY